MVVRRRECEEKERVETDVECKSWKSGEHSRDAGYLFILAKYKHIYLTVNMIEDGIVRLISTHQHKYQNMYAFVGSQFIHLISASLPEMAGL